MNTHGRNLDGGKLSLSAACRKGDLVTIIKEKLIHLCCKIWWFMYVQRFKDINVEHCCYLTMNSNRFNKTYACQFMTKLLLIMCSEKPCISGIYNILVLLHLENSTPTVFKITTFPVWPLFSVRTNVPVKFEEIMREEIMRKTQREEAPNKLHKMNRLGTLLCLCFLWAQVYKEICSLLATFNI